MNSSSSMNRSRTAQVVETTLFLLLLLVVSSATAQADNSNLHFQRPGAANVNNQQVRKFRRPGLEYVTDERPPASRAVTPQVARAAKSPARQPAARQPRATQQVARRQLEPQAQQEVARKPAALAVTKVARTSPAWYEEKVAPHERRGAAAKSRSVQYESDFTPGVSLASHGCELCEGPCSCDTGYDSGGFYEPGCGIAEPSCSCGEPSCGICEPNCGLYEPGCGIGEPSCGCGDVGCGSCVARPGPDYWCFPVCLPRFKDLSVFGGVQGFRGPRDFANNRSDSNFGFNEGLNLSGSAPLIGLLFPQLSYQLGYRAVQTRLHGTATSTNDRSQQFVTAGFFRRVNTGIQAGLVWDLMRDDLDDDIDLHQLRYEISLKSPQGREIGFFGTNSTNDGLSMGTSYETVDQYALFVRWAFGNGYESRLWGGGTGDGEGLFGGEFYAPLSSRWAVQSGFNYLITDAADGLAGVSEESWNIGINLVWHLGKTAKRGCHSPYRPLFSVADNGWMFVDQAP